MKVFLTNSPYTGSDNIHCYKLTDLTGELVIECAIERSNIDGRDKTVYGVMGSIGYVFLSDWLLSREEAVEAVKVLNSCHAELYIVIDLENRD